MIIIIVYIHIIYATSNLWHFSSKFSMSNYLTIERYVVRSSNFNIFILSRSFNFIIFERFRYSNDLSKMFNILNFRFEKNVSYKSFLNDVQKMFHDKNFAKKWEFNVNDCLNYFKKKTKIYYKWLLELF